MDKRFTQVKIRWTDILLSLTIIFALKVIYASHFGVRVQEDSNNYVFNVFDFEYPPLYPYFLYLSQRISPGLELAIILQSFIFSACAALFVTYFSTNRKNLLPFSVLMGLDPISSFFCTDIMSESLFISILFLCIVLIHAFFSSNNYSFLLVILIGITAGVLYLVRFSGILLIIAFFVIAVITPAHRKKFLFTLLIIFIGFQLILLPIRLKYKQVFGTYIISGNSGATLWNNASVLYCNSSVAKNPLNDFEKSLSHYDTNLFNQYNAIKGLQVNSPQSPFRSYVSRQNSNQLGFLQASNEAGNTAIKLIKEHPLKYFTEFVIPNFTQYFKEGQTLTAKAYEDNFTGKHLPRVYSSSISYPWIEWIILYALLFTSIILYVLDKRSLIARIIITISCCYMVILPFISPLVIRYELILFPLLLSCLFLQLTPVRMRA